MSNNRRLNKENENRLSSFGERLKRLSDTFYSTILQESEDKKIRIKNVKELEELKRFEDEDFTFDQCSKSEGKSNADFSFTFNSIVETNKPKSRKDQVKVNLF